MQKRGQITLYLIIAVVMLAAFGTGFYFLIYHEGPDVEQPSMTTTAALGAASNSMRSFVQSCLEKKTREAIDNYGLGIGRSEALIKNYIDSSMIECVDFAFFEREGYTVTEDGISSTVRITDDAVLVILDFPIRISTKTGKNAVELNEFEYNIQRVKSANPDPATGIFQTNAQIVSEDGDAEIIIPAKTRAYMPDGTSVGELSIRVEDKNAGGLSNSVVIGTTIYAGEPDGAVFDPYLTAKFIVDYSDVPAGLRYGTLKCAYYDSEADIWRTYESVSVKDNGVGERTYTVTCYVSHFSLLGVVQCGNPGVEYNALSQSFSYNPYFSNPLLPTEGDLAAYWFSNDALVKGGDSANRGIHLIPEKNTVPEGCDAGLGTTGKNVHIYTGTTSGTAGARAEYDIETYPDYCAQYLLQDWDNDDDPAKGADTFDYKFVDDNWADLSPAPKNIEEIKAGCYEDCSAKAKGIAAGEFPTLSSGGDYINDYLSTVYCTASRKEDKEVCDQNGQNCHMVFDGNYENPACKFETAPSGSHPFNNIESKYGDEIPTMEYPANPLAAGRNTALVATPMTYGYFKTKGEPITGITYDPSIFSSKLNLIQLGGYGQLELEMASDGDSCVLGQFTPLEPSNFPNAEVFAQTIDGKDLGLVSRQEDSKPLNLPADNTKLGDITETCTDNCIWTLNDPFADQEHPGTSGKLRGGINYLRIYVNNLALDGPDPDYWAKVQFRFIGIGLSQAEEDYGRVCWCVRKSETEYTDCALYPSMPSDGQLWVKWDEGCPEMGWGRGGDSIGEGEDGGELPTFCSAEERPTYYKCDAPLGCTIAEEVAGDKGCQDDIYDCHYCNDIDPAKVCCAKMKQVDSCNTTYGCVPKQQCSDSGAKELESGNAACEAFEPGRVCCEAKNKIEECQTDLGCVDSSGCLPPGNTTLESGNAGCQSKVGAGTVCCMANTTGTCTTGLGCVDTASCGAGKIIVPSGNDYCVTTLGEGKVCCQADVTQLAPCTSNIGCRLERLCNSYIHRAIVEEGTPACRAEDPEKVCCNLTTMP